jgi:DNA segregation ATPase FtsK/SpoIIIE, S-DNA-T family
MILRLTVRDSTTGLAHDVEVTADPESSMASLLDALPFDVGGRPAYVGGQLLDPQSTVGSSPLVSGATISVDSPGPDASDVPERAMGALRVVAGPDEGLVAWLPTGTYELSRGDDADVHVEDEQVSRRHAQLSVASSGAVTVADVGSSNGTFVDGAAAAAPLELRPEAVLEVGTDRLQWVPLPHLRLATTRSADGRLDFDRAFAPAPAVTRTEVVVPTKDTTERGIGRVLLAGLMPMAMAGVLFLATKRPEMLLFALMGPLTGLSSHFFDRRQAKNRDRAFEKAKAAAERKIADHVVREERLRRMLAPDEVDLTLAATGAARGLWPRNADSPDGLVLRVGTADRPAAVDLRGEPWEGFEEPVIRSVPVTVDLRTTGVLGVVGPSEPVDALVRWLLVQLGTLRSPDDLRLVVITSTDDDELGWSGWLPHVSAGEAYPFPCWLGNTQPTRAARVAELKDLVALRMAQRRSTGDVRFADEVVVVLHGALALRNLPGMKEVLRDGPSVGVYAICVDRQDMNECRGLVAFDGGSTSTMRVTERRDRLPEEAHPAGIGRETAEHIARALAPMRDRLTLSASGTTLPFPVRFLDLLGMSTPTSDGVLSLWSSQPGLTTEVALGADGSGVVTVDLAKQGPHTMLGGATGAGKSILLQTLVTSLLLANRPDELNLVLVDFKGGSAFLPFQRCPHVVGLIRSTGETPADVFDEAAAARVLASVRAEVRRRESMLARYGGEIDEYWKAASRRTGMAPLPRLVMIFDEFARVLETSPDFLKELVNVAAKGRSLGMHLVLATQSLQGKLSPELKNNIDLRITLRQNEPADSVEVLGVPDAAAIPGRLRGRGMILCTKDETRTPRLFQSGYLGNPPPTGEAPPARVRIVEWKALGAPRPEERTDTGDAPTDQELAIGAIEEASRRLALPAPFRPLLPPLPAEIPLEDLAGQVTGQVPETWVPFGLADDPAAQAQPAAALDLAGSDRLLVGGGPQSGRTTFVRTLVTSLASRFRPDQAHVYIVEQRPSGLGAYAGLPHVGAVLSPAEPDRIRRLVTWLDAEVQRRTVSRLAATGTSDPWIVVVVDGWEHFENRSDPNFTETSLLGTLRTVVAAGPPVGVHVVAVGGQEMMNGKLPTLYSRRLLLPFPKEETRRQNLVSGAISPPVLPGRAVDGATGEHVQICRPSLLPGELIARVGEGFSGGDLAQDRLPLPFPAMPVRVTLDELNRPAMPPSPTWVAMGVGGSGATVGLDLFEAGPHVAVVSGPSGSGRTTAAASLAHGLRRAGIGVLVVAPPRSPLPKLLPLDGGVRVVTGTTIKDADLRDAAAIFGDGRYAVLLDDCEQITLTPTEAGFSDAPTLLEDIVSPGALGRQALVLCGDATPILSGQRRSLARVLSEIMSGGTRLLLTPTSSPVAREHGFVLEPDQFFAGPPGRGYLAVGRSAELVHLATP